MNDEFREAGKVVKRVLRRAAREVDVGDKLLEIAEYLEDCVRDQGAEPAFPVNLSLNEVAAHYTPSPDDEIEISPGDILKIDIGAHVNGAIGDAAITLSFDNDLGELLAEVAREALEAAIAMIRPGVECREVGRAIGEVCRDYGFKPVIGLTGHQIEPWNLHAGVSIPNDDLPGYEDKLEEGMVLAVEPFVTTEDGKGDVRPGSTVEIFSVRNPNQRSRLDLHRIYEDRKSLPFARRWVKEATRMKFELLRLSKLGAVKAYPELVEVNGEPVAQWEHTVMITERGCRVLTE
ncbi:type II methionyl aminopeptidase [Methanopyrus sp. KOL6]|uniref:type II methionyl aminopeptidase n=1 Tax=Methanopyrus sp. KOL6 TaxID=1937004 RepID=UPI0012FA0215|nr:type II methionyl aminopeptidase [Methanopyrus sp. KOL6]